MKKTYIVEETFNDMRIDRWLRNKFGKIPQGLIERNLRNDAYKTKCPTIVNKLEIKDKNKYFSHEWYKSNQIAKKYNATLKFTLPGPMTICETLSNIYYKNDKEICNDLVPLLRREVLYLKSIGCKEIQIDEPLFARQPQKALDWGIDLLDCVIKDISDIFFDPPPPPSRPILF